MSPFFFGNRCCCGSSVIPCDLSGCSWVETSFANVTTETVSFNSGGGAALGSYSVINEIDLAAGDAAPCRKISIACDTIPETGSDGFAAVAWVTKAHFNPSQLCALVLNFCFESKKNGFSIPNGDSTSGVCFFVKQDGIVYRTIGIRPQNGWARILPFDFFVAYETSFTSNNLSAVIPPSTTPDFTSAGSNIEFGVGLYLSVDSGLSDPPSVSAFFDNLCVEVNDCLAGGCDPSGADFFLTSDFTIDDDGFGFCYGPYPLGAGSLSASLSETSYGFPNQSILVHTEWDSVSGADSTFIVQSYINLNISGPGPIGDCKILDYIDLCWMARGKTWRASTEYDYLFATFGVVVFQDGKRYRDSRETHPSAGSVIPDFSTWGQYGWRIKTWENGSLDHSFDEYITNAGLSGEPCGLDVFSESPNLNEPFELGFSVIRRNQHNGSTNFQTGYSELYLDNISATFVFEACFRGSFQVSLTGVSLSANPVLGCDSSLINTVSTYLDSDFVLTKVSGACNWRYSSATFTAGSYHLRFRIDLYCTVSDECFFVDGYLLVTIESKIGSGLVWESEQAVYQLDSVYSVSGGPGSFSFESIAGDAVCLDLVAAGTLSVSQVT